MAEIKDKVVTVEGLKAKHDYDETTYAKKSDVYTKAEADEAFASKDNVPDDVYTKSESDEKFATITALDNKVDKISGKGLSTNDYDATAKSKVDAIPNNPKYTDTVYDDTSITGRVSAIEAKESVWDAKSDFSGSYNDLTDKPTVSDSYTKTEFDARFNNIIKISDTQPTDTDNKMYVKTTTETLEILEPSDVDDIRASISAIESKTSIWDAKSDFSGSYNDLTDIPVSRQIFIQTTEPEESQGNDGDICFIYEEG